MSISVALYKLLSKIRGEKPKKNNPGSKSIEYMINQITKNYEPGGGSGGNLDEFIAGNLQSVKYDGTIVPDFAFSSKSKLEEVNVPNVIYIGKYAFSSAAASSQSGSGSGSESESSSDGEYEDENTAFNNNSLKTVIMPNVTNIEEYAFANDPNLEITELPDSLIVIGDYAFQNCQKVQLISLPENVVYVGDGSINTIENFDFDNLPEDLVYLGSGTTFEAIQAYLSQFVDSETGVLDISLISPVLFGVEIGSSIKQDHSNIFEGFTLPDPLVIPDGVKRIASGLFAGCVDNTTSIIIPSSVTSIGNSAFIGCGALTSLEIPSSVTSIGNSAFSYCQALTSLTLHEGLEMIGNSAFNDCIVLTSLEIPSSVTSIGNNAFIGCGALTSLEIPSSVTSIGNSAFSYCQALTSLTLHEGLETIGSNAFNGCNALTSLEIPSSVTSIGNSAFNDCQALIEIDMTKCVSVVVVIDNSFNVNGYFAAGFKVEFATQQQLDNYAADSNWAYLSSYFVVAS